MSQTPDQLRLQQDLLPRQQLSGYLRGGQFGSTEVVQQLLQAFANLVGMQLTGAGPDEIGTPVLLGADGNKALYVRLQPSTGVVTTGQVQVLTSTTAIVAADSKRNSVAIVNMDTTNPVWIGGASVNAGNGYQLNAGQAISLSTTAAISGHGGSNTLYVAYLTLPA